MGTTDDGGDRSDDADGTSRPTGLKSRLPWIVAAAAAVVASGVLVTVVRGGDEVTTSGSSSSAASTTTTSANSTTSSVASTVASSTAVATTNSIPTTTLTPATGGIDPLQGAGTAPVATPRPDVPTTHLTDVRVARQEGYDRVVFQFDGAVPGYDVRYVGRPITEDPSDRPVTVTGDAVLAVRMEPASGVDLGGNAYRQTYTGPTRIPGTGGEVTEVVRTGDFEAVLTWVIGLRERVDFRVSTLTAPSRLVIDVRNH